MTQAERIAIAVAQVTDRLTSTDPAALGTDDRAELASGLILVAAIYGAAGMDARRAELIRASREIG